MIVSTLLWETVLGLAEGVRQALPEIPQRISDLMDHMHSEDGGS